MLTLDVALRIPEDVMFTNVEQDTVLLNTRTNKYYVLDEVGALLWGMLSVGRRLRESYAILLDEYEVEPARLEKDILDLLKNLAESGLVEVVSA